MTRDEILITLTATGQRAGLLPTALADYLRRGLERFALDEAPQAEVESWLTTTKAEAPHLFSAAPARQRSTSPIAPEHEGLSATEKLARYRPQGVKRERPQPVVPTSAQQTELAKLSATQRLTAYRKMQAEQA